MKQFISKIRHLIQLSGLWERRCQTGQTIPTLTQPHAYQSPAKNRNTKSASNTIQASAPIEKLPPELRHQILCLLDLDGLRDLTQTSPVFLQQYLANRTRILSPCLDRTLGSTGLDAYWAYQTGQPKFLQGLTPGRIETFNKIYKHQRSSASCSILDQELSNVDLDHLASFHSSIVDPTLRLFSQQALQNLAEEAGKPFSNASFSEVEQKRLLRAFYRYQITCNLLAHGKFGRSRFSTEDSWSGQILGNYVRVFEPWEIEEIACVHAFAKRMFGMIFEALNQVKSFHLNQSSKYKQDLLEGTTCQGLITLRTALCKSKDLNQLVSVMQNTMTDSRNNFQGDILSESAQSFRRRTRFTDRDRKEQQREEMLFNGDDEAKPSLAWTSIWDGTYSNIYGNVIPDELRRWGYVMWDATRMESSGATDVLKRQWDQAWGSEDPRYEEL